MINIDHIVAISSYITFYPSNNFFISSKYITLIYFFPVLVKQACKHPNSIRINRRHFIHIQLNS